MRSGTKFKEDYSVLIKAVREMLDRASYRPGGDYWVKGEHIDKLSALVNGDKIKTKGG